MNRVCIFTASLRGKQIEIDIFIRLKKIAPKIEQF